MHEIEYYLALRRRYEPVSIKLVVVAESPPASGKYFYDPEGSIKEPLFTALMQQFGYEPSTKEQGLQALQRDGRVLVDATYQPVNKLIPADRDEVIEKDYFRLRLDLERLNSDRSAPLILIKANVCRILEPKLKEDHFNVLNRGSRDYFPSNGQQTRFHQQFGAILKSARISN